jgi:hypothetical protein
VLIGGEKRGGRVLTGVRREEGRVLFGDRREQNAHWRGGVGEKRGGASVNWG